MSQYCPCHWYQWRVLFSGRKSIVASWFAVIIPDNTFAPFDFPVTMLFQNHKDSEICWYFFSSSAVFTKNNYVLAVKTTEFLMKNLFYAALYKGEKEKTNQNPDRKMSTEQM